MSGQANRALSSPDSSGGVSQGSWCCPGHPRHGRACQLWPFTFAFCGRCPFGGLRGPCMPPALKSPYQRAHPGPSPLLVVQRRFSSAGCGPGHGDCSAPSSVPMSSPQSPNIVTGLLPRAPDCRRWHVSLSHGHSIIPLSVPIWPGGPVLPLPPVPCHFVPGTPFSAGPGAAHTRVAWLSSYRCVWGLPSPGVLQIPQIQPFCCAQQLLTLQYSVLPHPLTPACSSINGLISGASSPPLPGLAWEP